MSIESTWITRQLRWLGARRNPVATTWDRLEARVVAVAIVLSLGMLPVALAVGSHTYESALADATEQQASRTQTTAVVLADAPYTVNAHGVAEQAPARAVWQLPDGTERTGDVYVDPGTTAGTETPIWIDQAGDPTLAPLTRDGALGAAVGVAVLAWVGLVGLIALLTWGAHVALDRARGADLARDWQRLSRDLKPF